MSKYDAYLTDVVYEIDDVIYDFYQKSNELISKKRNQEKLFEYRDKTIETINDMNVRSLEIIADVRKKELVEERANLLIQRNEEILNSALNVIETAPSRGDLMHEVKVAASQMLGKASDLVSGVRNSETYHNIKEGTVKGYERLRDKVKDVSEDERVKDGIKTVKDKSIDLYHKGEKVVGEGVDKIKDWVHDAKSNAEDVVDDVEDVYEDVKDKAEDKFEAAKDAVEDVVDDAKDVYEDVKDDVEDKFEAAKDVVEDVVDDTKDVYEDVKDETEHKTTNLVDEVKEGIDNLKDTYENVKEDVAEEGEDFLEAARKQLENLENEDV